MLTAIAWVSSPSETGNSNAVTWSFRIVTTAGLVLALWLAVKEPFNAQLAEKLKEIQPAQESLCPFCDGQIILDGKWRCANCGVERTALPSSKDERSRGTGAGGN